MANDAHVEKKNLTKYKKNNNKQTIELNDVYTEDLEAKMKGSIELERQSSLKRVAWKQIQ